MTAYYERVISRAEPDGECLVWTGARQPTGYGQIWNGIRPEQVHRIVYRSVHGSIPDGMEIDHLCRNRSCVRIDHLEAVPHKENMRRSKSIMAENAAKTHCKRGHEFSGSNLYLAPNGTRHCRACSRVHAANARGRRKAVVS